jgi:hypothetical protein
MPPRAVGTAHLRSFINLFIDERSHFYSRQPGQAVFAHHDRWLTDGHVQRHLEGRWWIAVTRADATRILSVDLDCNAGPDPVGAMFKRYDRIRKIMPEPVVFQSSNSHGLHLYWLVEEEVPTAAAVALMARIFAEQGVQVGRGACEIRPTIGQCLRLPLGDESVLLNPDSLLQYGTVGTDPGASIDFLAHNIKRCRAQYVLDRLTNAGRQLSFSAPTTPCRPGTANAQTPVSTMIPSTPPMVPARPYQAGLTEREMAVLWTVTSQLPGLLRYRQMQFLFDVVLAFKATKSDTMALPKRKLVKMAGAHSGTYQDRLDFAETVGLLTCVNHRRRARRHPRQFRLGMAFDGPGEILKVEDGLDGRDLDFLSPRMRSKVSARGDVLTAGPEA